MSKVAGSGFRVLIAIAFVALALVLPRVGHAQWLGAACQPSEPATEAVVDALRAAESSVPEHRVAAPGEVVVDGVNAEQVARAAEASDGAEVGALLAWLRWVAPSAVDAFDVPMPRDGTCATGPVTLLASVTELERSEVDALLPMVRLVYETRPVPEAATRRLATHAFLATHAPLLDALADGEALQQRADTQTRTGVLALAEAARGRVAAAEQARVGLLPEDPWRQWVLAEVARQARRYDEAALLCEQALEADPLFAAAIFTRAAVRLDTGAGELTLSDVEHLRRTYGPDGPYHSWTDRLDGRMR